MGLAVQNERIDSRTLRRALAETGYDGWISAEYRPTGPTRDSLGWMPSVREAFSRPR